VVFLTPGLEDRSFDIVSIEDENHSPLDSSRNDEIVWVTVPEEVRIGDLVRKPFDVKDPSRTTECQTQNVQ